MNKPTMNRTNRNEAPLSQTASQKFSPQFSHQWVSVVNPYNRRSLLQACDDCGVVKSENSVIKRCTANKNQGLISRALYASVNLAV